jgi:hypothetical protein
VRYERYSSAATARVAFPSVDALDDRPVDRRIPPQGVVQQPDHRFARARGDGRLANRRRERIPLEQARVANLSEEAADAEVAVLHDAHRDTRR